MKLSKETKEVLTGVINWLLPIAAHSERNADNEEDRQRQRKFAAQLNTALNEINQQSKS